MFEQMVMGYLTRSGNVFVCPLYSIEQDWSCPDFVALYFSQKMFWVVEVSAARDIAVPAGKIIDRNHLACEAQS